MARTPYLTDLSDGERAIIAPVFPQPVKLGRPRTHSLREITNAIFYLLQTGCQWRHLPHEFLPWQTVYSYFRTWCLSGLWGRLKTYCANKCDSSKDATPNPVQGASIANQSKPPVLAAHAAMMAASASVDVNGISSSIRTAWCDKAWYIRPVSKIVQLCRSSSPTLTRSFRHFSTCGWIRDTAVPARPGSKTSWVDSHRCTASAQPRGTATRTGFRGVLPRRWVVERAIAWLGQIAA